MKDYYKILEIEENATEEQIKKSYRNLSKKYHPDVNPEGAEKFKEIAEAYDVLSNKEKREDYNFKKNNPMSGHGSFQDFFNQMFNNRNPEFTRRKNAPDKILKVQISPIDSYLGSDKTIHYMKNNPCNHCNGTGGERQVCSTCAGQGHQIKTFGTGFMVQQMRVTCDGCGGRGYTLIHKCYHCGGQGIKTEMSEVRIKLPVGIDDGQFVRLSNRGDFRNGEVGDLVVQLEVIPKDGFEKLNNDLIYNLILDLEKIQSEKFTIPHPDGDLVINSPKIVDTSRPLRLRGKGYNGGDMYVKLVLRFEKAI